MDIAVLENIEVVVPDVLQVARDTVEPQALVTVGIGETYGPSRLERRQDGWGSGSTLGMTITG